VNRALVQLQGVTQQNAALVQQAASAAVSFKEESAKLFDLVARFRVDQQAFRAGVPDVPRLTEAG